MNCPVCGSNTNVISTRKDCEGVYRIRVCVDPKCKHQFFTSELESDRFAYDELARRDNYNRYHEKYNKKHNKNYNKNG